MEAESVGEQTIVQGDLNDVLLGHARGGQQSGGAFPPVSQVVLRVTHNDRLGGRARGGVDSHDVPQRDCEHVVGIALEQVVLRGERKLADPLKVLDPFEVDAVTVEGRLIERDVAVYAIEG